MNGDNPQREVAVPKVSISMDEVLREAGMPPAREAGPLTQIGYKLAIFLLIYLAVVTLILLIDYLVNVPSLPKSASLDDAALKQYEQLSQIAVERTLKLLDALVLKGFLPVLTAVLGYIFGTRGADKEQET